MDPLRLPAEVTERVILLLSGEDLSYKGKRFQGKHALKSGCCSVKNSCLFIKISIAINLSEGKSLHSLLLVLQTGFH